jgi:hypothetical protein
MKVDWTIPSEFLQNEHAGIPARLLFVALQQTYGGRHLIVHEMFTKSSATDFSNLSEGLGSSKHDVEVAIRQKGLDIIVEAKKILFEFNCLFPVHVEKMVYEDKGCGSKKTEDTHRWPISPLIYRDCEGYARDQTVFD